MSVYAVRMVHMRGTQKGEKFTANVSAATAKGARNQARQQHPTATPVSTRRMRQ